MQPIFVEILTIGDEILYGHIQDTNSHWLCCELGKAGFRVSRKVSVGDKLEEITAAFSEARSRAQIVICTGGLGPTSDDKTIEALARYFDQPLVLHNDVLENIRSLYFKKGRELNKMTIKQAHLPEHAQPLMNCWGTAPGLWLENAEAGQIVIALPGIPHEMKQMVKEFVLPQLRQRFKPPFIIHQLLRIIHVTETELAERLETWEQGLPEHIRLAYLPRVNMVRLRLSAIGPDLHALQREIDEQIEKVKPLLGRNLVSIGEEDLVATVGGLLLQRGETVATAESCTGGLIAHKITEIPGCSAWFRGGIVAYSNEAKISELGVSAHTIAQHGAVSEQTAREMAENVRARYGATYGIAVTGIAGPTGAVPGKPVGTVYIGYADENQSKVERLNISDNRQINVSHSMNSVLDLLRMQILSK